MILFEPGAESQEPHRWRILIVEDDPAYVGLIATMLGAAGWLTFDFEHAPSLAAANERLRSATFDIILLALGAVRHGAQDFLVKTEVTAPVLARSVAYALERKHSEVETKRLAFRD